MGKVLTSVNGAKHSLRSGTMVRTRQRCFGQSGYGGEARRRRFEHRVVIVGFQHYLFIYFAFLSARADIPE
jgi:hypothetical protein